MTLPSPDSHHGAADEVGCAWLHGVQRLRPSAARGDGAGGPPGAEGPGCGHRGPSVLPAGGGGRLASRLPRAWTQAAGPSDTAIHLVSCLFFLTFAFLTIFKF